MFEHAWGEDTAGDFLSPQEIEEDESRLVHLESLFPESALRSAIERFLERVPAGDHEHALGDPVELLRATGLCEDVLENVRHELAGDAAAHRGPTTATTTTIDFEVLTARTELARYWSNAWLWALEVFESEQLHLSPETLHPQDVDVAGLKKWDDRRREYLDNMYFSVSLSNDEIPAIDREFARQVFRRLGSDGLVELPARIDLRTKNSTMILSRRARPFARQR